MDDVPHRRARYNHQRTGPEVVAQVAHGHDTAVQTFQMVLHDVGQQHRHDQHQEHLVQNLSKRRQERDVGPLLYQRETERRQQHRHEVRQEGVRRHLLQ